MIPRPSDDAGYFHARAEEETIAARRATSIAARDRHEELAAIYSFRERILLSRSGPKHAAEAQFA